MSTIVWLQKSCGIMGLPLEYTVREMYMRYKEVIFDYRIFRKTAIISQATFQDMAIEDLALVGDVKASSVQIRIKNLKDTHSQNRRIKSMLRKNRGTGVTKFHTADASTNGATEHTTKEAIEQANVVYLPELFLYADYIPLRISPLLEEFGNSLTVPR